MRKETRLFQISLIIITSRPMRRRAERHTMNNNFVKLGESIINIGSIDGIFPDTNNYNGGWIIQLNSKDIHVNDIQPVLDAINMKQTSTFDPDKRITPASVETTATADTFDQKAMKVKLLVTEYNKDRIYPLTVNIDNINKMIAIWDGTKKMIIKDGVITEDTLGDYSRLNKIKTDIIKLFV